jgi:hypothetical protein
MGLKFFHISSRSPDPIEAELNVFLARHRVVTVERRFVEDGADSFWAVCGLLVGRSWKWLGAWSAGPVGEEG